MFQQQLKKLTGCFTNQVKINYIKIIELEQIEEDLYDDFVVRNKPKKIQLKDEVKLSKDKYNKHKPKIIQKSIPGISKKIVVDEKNFPGKISNIKIQFCLQIRRKKIERNLIMVN